jgi:hypothetical protein
MTLNLAIGAGIVHVWQRRRREFALFRPGIGVGFQPCLQHLEPGVAEGFFLGALFVDAFEFVGFEEICFFGRAGALILIPSARIRRGDLGP